MNLDFLSNVKLEVIETKAKAPRPKQDTTPAEGSDIRVFASGKAFPSKAFADAYGLEFQPKVNIAAEGEPEMWDVLGNGLDVFSSLDWGMIKGKLPQELIFCAAVPKTAAKVDMWASTKYEDDNTPKASVFTQGGGKFVKDQLLPMLTAVYGVNWETVEYVDLSVAKDSVITSETGVYALPKVVSTGAHKGEATYIRRENLTICPLILDTVLPVNEVAPSLDTAEAQPEQAATAEIASDVQEGEVSADANATQDWSEQLGS